MGEESSQPRDAIPGIPPPLVWLYVIATAFALAGLVSAGLIADSVGFPAASFQVGTLLGAAVGSFIPPLVAHSIVVAIRDR